MDGVAPYPLYNSTFQAFRLSPLYTGESLLLHRDTLRSHAGRLRELLKGDNVRGIQLDSVAPDSALDAAGPLENCHWGLLGDEEAWVARQLDASYRPDEQTARGIRIVLQYPRNMYTALLLRDNTTAAASSLNKFTALPLLLVKMPAPIRNIVAQYLMTAFDTRVAPLKLAPAFFMAVLDAYFARLAADGSKQSIAAVVQQLQLQIAFPAATTLLKHMDITIARDDVSRFYARGQCLREASRPTSSSSSAASGAAAAAAARRQQQQQQQQQQHAHHQQQTAFAAALAVYLRAHLALDWAHPAVQLARVSCAAFTLTADGRVKLAPPPLLPEPDPARSPVYEDAEERSPAELAMVDLCAALVREAAGAARFVPANISDDAYASAPARGRGRR